MEKELYAHLYELIKRLNKNLDDYLKNEAPEKMPRHATYSIYTIFIAINIANLFMEYNRKIESSENYWFDGARAHHDIFVGSKWEVIYHDFNKLTELLENVDAFVGDN